MTSNFWQLRLSFEKACFLKTFCSLGKVSSQIAVLFVVNGENSSSWTFKLIYGNKGLTLKLPTLGSGNIELKYEHKPMQTGLKTVDSLVPMYYGKRELIIGGLTN